MRSSNSRRRIAAIGLMLILAIVSLGKAAHKPQQSDPKKSQRPASEVPRSDANQSEQAIKLQATLVTVPVIASDREGRYIPDMRREQFSLYEDGASQEIVFFATINEPFHVVLMLDTSASTQEKLGQIRSAAAAFVEQLKPADRVKVISFDDETRDLCAFTSDRAELKGAIDQTRPGQGTKLYDAVALALRVLRTIEGRKAVVLFTDGVDDVSARTRYEDNILAVEESGVIVYPIRYNTRVETEALVRSQGGLGGVIKRPPTGTTPPTVPGGDMPRLPPIGPPTGDIRIPPVESPFPRTTPYPGGRSENRYPQDNRYPRDNRYPQDRFPQDNRYPQDNRLPGGRDPDPRQNPRRDDPVTVQLDAQYELADRYLNDLAAFSGGKVSRADTLYSLPAAFAQIAAELRTQYALGYYPSNAARDGSYRKIQVRTNRKKVVIRARPGYRAPAGP